MHIYSSADMHISTILFENMKKVKKILVKMMDDNSEDSYDSEDQGDNSEE